MDTAVLCVDNEIWRFGRSICSIEVVQPFNFSLTNLRTIQFRSEHLFFMRAEKSRDSQTSIHSEGEKTLFRDSIKRFVDLAESNARRSYSIPWVCQEFSFQKRRFYDVMNVLEAIGCLQRATSESFTWLGLGRFTMCIQRPRLCFQGATPNSISISLMTHQFMTFFMHVHDMSVDLKSISGLLARHNQRFKTTLCKLYQISHILEAAGILEKSQSRGTVRIVEKYRDMVRRPSVAENLLCDAPLSLEALLNKPISTKLPNAYTLLNSAK